MTYQCEFEQQPKYSRCTKEADGVLITKPPASRQHKAKYCSQHGGFVQQQLKGTYVKVINWVKFSQEK